jgi:eukaryotic-like serine/threonine-protein kinase
MERRGRDSGETATLPAGSAPGMAKEWTASLPVIQIGPAQSGAEFQLEAALGEGGMGRVVSANQVALQRSVAVKFLKDEHGDSSALLREAVVTGRLEHSNIVPVHVLARSAEGEAFFTMKRVEGTPWSDALGKKRTLVEHLEVLHRVCDAVAFAHSREVIHRDIKPANVLIGSFGEVYLVDWGLAAALRPDRVLPLASEAGMGGTPAYLAPELVNDVTNQGAWTDVFLLGATLYELLMGRPPWLAGSVAESLALAAEAKEPAFDASVPAELAGICRRAMQKSPAARFAGASAFKDAITDYLRHREALEMHDRAMTLLAELERLAKNASAEQSVHGLSIQRLFTECRFGFEQVRRSWPEFKPAREGLRRAQMLLIGHELALRAPRAARVLLSELEQPPAELVAAVEEAEALEREKAARLTQLEEQARDLSPEAARSFKAFSVRLVAVMSTAAALVAQALETSGVYRFTTRDGVVLSIFLLLSSLLYWRSLSRQADVNQLQHRTSVSLVGLSVVSAVGWLLAWRHGADAHFGLLLFFVVNAAGWWAGAMIEPRGRRVAAGFVLAALVGELFPAYATGAGVFVGLGYWLLADTLRAGGRTRGP